MEAAESITARRLAIWEQYHKALESLEVSCKLSRQITPLHCQHNAHMYYVLLDSLGTRMSVIEGLKQQGINSVFHYVPLHASPAGQRFGRVNGLMENTERLADRLLRLPLWLGMEDHVKIVSAELSALL